MTIEKSTVLILGAGASSDFRLPLGLGLLNEVCTSLATSERRQLLLELGHREEESAAFLAELQNSGETSVDAFLEANPDYLHIGKRAMAAALLPLEGAARLKPPHAPDRHWYRSLFRRMLPLDEQWESRNSVAVLTFNYDRTLERWFAEAVAQRTRVTFDDAMRRVQNALHITHLHGSLGPVTPAPAQGVQLTPEAVRAAANAIVVPSEADDAALSPEFRMAASNLREAARIYFLGFGFHAVNVRRLGFFANAPGTERPTVGGTATLSAGEWDRVSSEVLNGWWTGPRFTSICDFVDEDGDWT